MAQSKVFKGVVWASIQRFGTLGISFISNMVLARLLTPDDFGTIGMLMFFIAIAQTFVDSGFGAALIQKKDVTKEDVNTVFYINMSMSLLVYIILFFSAPYISKFYSIQILCPLLRVQGVIVVIQGFTLIQTIQLQKQLDFKRISICNIVGSLTLAFIGIGAALLGFGVWSLVIRTVVGTLTTSILLWAFSNWKPAMIFSIQSFKRLFGFGGFILLSSLMTSISQNIQSMILGKMFRPSTLGNFTQARNLRNLSSESISMVINQVLYPEFSNHQEDNQLIEAKLNQSTYLISYIVCSMMAFFILCSEPLIYIIYGNQWFESIPYFQIFCFGALPVCLQDININVIKAKGKSKILFILNIIKLAIYLAMMIVSAKIWGIYGFIWVMVLYALFGYFAFAYIGTKLIKSNLYGQMICITKSIIYALIPFIIVFIVNQFFPIKIYLLWISISAILYFSTFVFVSHITHCYPYEYLIKNIISKLKKMTVLRFINGVLNHFIYLLIAIQRSSLFKDSLFRFRSNLMDPSFDGSKYEKKVNPYFAKYGFKFSQLESKYCSECTGVDSDLYIPVVLYNDYIYPYLNPDAWRLGYCDKNMFKRLIDIEDVRKHVDVLLPECIVCCDNGRFFLKGDILCSRQDAINAVLKSNDDFIIKPSLDSSHGHGVRKISASDCNMEFVTNLFDSYGLNFTVQKIIIQHPNLAAYNPTSVNTIRITTYQDFNGNVKVLYASQRFGGKGKVYDNADDPNGTGGFCAINPDGTVKREIHHYRNKKIDRLNDSVPGITPCFDKVVKAVKYVHTKFPQFGIIGWDVTVTPDEHPLIIEYNFWPGLGTGQLANGPIFKKEDLDEIMSKISDSKVCYRCIKQITFKSKPCNTVIR